LFYGAGAALGFALALVLFAGLRERLVYADVPVAFRGASIAFVTAGILALAFMAFSGFARL
jgi:electron transport complex protein RnfA